MAKAISKLGITLWDHKKKTAFASCLLYLGGHYGAKWNLNRKIRTAYAKEALQYGQMSCSAEDHPRRVCVLVNVSANQRHCYDDFTKNALPLMHLAGIQVDIIKADSESQLEKLAAVVDHQEADAIYVVGGDGTIGRVITGILRNRDTPVLPVGVFPGGYNNLTLRRLVPQVFESDSDVRHMCESVMALIEDKKTSVAAFELSVKDSPSEPLYGIGDIGVGWFQHIEEKSRKFWYFGSIKRRWAYFWEMMKRSPISMEAHLTFEEHCKGCRSCRPPIIYQALPWRWWHILTGPPRIKELEVKPKDYSDILNEYCGRMHEIEIKGTDLLIENEQLEDSCCLHLRIGGINSSRLALFREGWSRCSAEVVGNSPNKTFYSVDVLAKNIILQFDRLPEFIRKLYVSSDAITDFEDKKVIMRSTDRRIEMFLPNNLRVDINNI